MRGSADFMGASQTTGTDLSKDPDLSRLGELVARAHGDGVSWRAEKMPGGASTRVFYRLHIGDRGASAVAFYVPDATRSDEIDKTDGTRHRWPFLEVQELLAERGVRVPRIVADGSDDGWLLVEDLGDDTLAAYLSRDLSPTRKERAYQTAVRDLAEAQVRLADLPVHSVVRKRAFDEDLLAWEIHHFREYALEARGIHLSPSDRTLFDGIAHRLAHRIASWPRGFVHRDYQSRNIMVRGPSDDSPELWWIDFQDALLGPRVYDLVALLNDSYQTFDRDFVERRLDEFAAVRGLDETGRLDLGREFDLVTVQRKLKDAGRFVFIDQVKGNPSFLPFVKPTIEKARASLARLGDDEDMRALAGILGRVLG
jgi:aminoglycoside/choline kinase family phosphotransferase